MTLKIGGAKNHKAVITSARKNINQKKVAIKNSIIRKARAKHSLDWKIRQIQLNYKALTLHKEANAATMKRNISQGDQVVRRSTTSQENLLLSKLATLNLQEETITMRQLQLNIAALALKQEAKAANERKNIIQGDQAVERNLSSQKKAASQTTCSFKLAGKD